MSWAYYNEVDPFCCEWLRRLIASGLIAPGEVDERSIEDVRPDDLRGFTQCHFFAGIGVWSLALINAGWPDNRPVWTGSCPCQPFSSAGARRGVDDERHLWPHWRWLVDQCRPPVVFGEQVASKDGRTWCAGVRTDLEAMGYAVGAADLCAAGVGAPHIRQRLYWVADAGSRGHAPRAVCKQGCSDEGRSRLAATDCSGMGNADIAGSQAGRQAATADGHGRSADADGGARGLGDADDARSQGRGVLPERADELSPWAASLDNWLPCADGKARRIEPGIEPLAHGAPGRVGRLRAYGNAIVAPLAQAFVEACMELLP